MIRRLIDAQLSLTLDHTSGYGDGAYTGSGKGNGSLPQHRNPSTRLIGVPAACHLRHASESNGRGNNGSCFLLLADPDAERFESNIINAACRMRP